MLLGAVLALMARRPRGALQRLQRERRARVPAQLINMLVALGVDVGVRQHPAALPACGSRCPPTSLGVLLLVGVALFGEIVNGARRWLHVGHHAHPALGAHEDRGAADAGVVFRPLRGDPAAHALRRRRGDAARAGRADRAPAGSRHRGADHRQRVLRAVSRRPVVAHHRRARASPALAALPLAVVGAARLPAPAHAHAARSDRRIRSARAITPSSPRSRSAPAACSARAG